MPLISYLRVTVISTEVRESCSKTIFEERKDVLRVQYSYLKNAN